MSPSEVLNFLLIGVVVIAAIIGSWLLFRKRKKLALALTGILVIGYIGYYLYYPTFKMNTHAERYSQIIEYLAENYPDKEYTISPEHYEVGYRVGEFTVNDNEIPLMGVTLRVDKEGRVTQVGTWSKLDYPTQKELWREIEYIHGETYTLDKDIADITKEDEWINGELTAFALTIDEIPTIAIFTYSKAGYGLLELQQGEREEFVILEENGYIFSYTDKRYEKETVTKRLKNGQDYTLNVSQQKGRLLVEKQ